MAAKKPPVKATKAKKTVAKKAEPVKKAAPAKKTAEPVAARSKPATERPAPQPVNKPVGKVASPVVVKPAKPVAAASTVADAAQSVSVIEPRQPIPARPSVIRNIEPEPTPAANDADDSDALESSTNLLAGPRNVKPYIPRRGEQYMSKEQLEHFRQILATWKKDLMQEVDRTVLHMKDEAANFPDPNDRATQESEFSLELRTRDRERKLIRKIEEAIKRIDDGTYGYCNETGEEIGIKRLEARPVATLCVEAQERRERREKQYGDRDDRYR